MTDVNGYPETYRGCKIKVVHLSPDMIAIAKQGYAGDDWGAYIGSDKLCGPLTNADGTVRTRTLEECAAAVLENGSKLEYRLAKAIFPTFDKEFRWRP